MTFPHKKPRKPGSTASPPLVGAERSYAIELLCHHLPAYLRGDKPGLTIAKEIAEKVRSGVPTREDVAHQFFWELLRDAFDDRRIKIEPSEDSTKVATELRAMFPQLNTTGGVRVANCRRLEDLGMSAAQEFYLCLSDVAQSKKDTPNEQQPQIHIGVVGGTTCRAVYDAVERINPIHYLGDKFQSRKFKVTFYALHALERPDPTYDRAQALVIATKFRDFFTDFFANHADRGIEVACLGFAGTTLPKDASLPADWDREYNQSVLAVTEPDRGKTKSLLDIVLFSPGAFDHSILAMALRDEERKELLKKGCVGDVIYYPVDEAGQSLEIKIREIKTRHPYAAVQPDTLRTLAVTPHRHVIAVAMNSADQNKPQQHEKPRQDKTKVLHAVCRNSPNRSIANHLVTSIETAKALLEHVKNKNREA